MAISILGTPSFLINTAGSVSASFTPVAGSSRIVAAVGYAFTAGAQTLTSITYNSIVRSPTIFVADNGSATPRVAVGICIFKEAELSASAQTMSTQWTAAPADSQITAITLGGVDQAVTVRTTGSGTTNGTTSTAVAAALSGMSVGDFELGALNERSNVSTHTLNNGWTLLDRRVSSNGASYDSDYQPSASGSSDTYSITLSGLSDWSAVAMALIPSAAGIQLMGQNMY